jgi:deazaflavin-dependent oxidoreductase (nitroreductase family)
MLARMPEPKPRPKGLDSPLVPKVLKYGGRAQVRLYRLTNGRIGGTWRIGAGFRRPVPVLLLDHVGRRTGRRYTVPLLYLRAGDDLVVVASQGGLPRHPQWFHNLVAAPETTVQVGAEQRRVRARVAPAEEKRALWPRLVELYADFASYQSWTERDIPVVVLERA